MALMYRVTTGIVGTGAAGGGMATHYFLADTGTPEDAVASVKAMWLAVDDVIHSGTTMTVAGDVEVVDITTGLITDVTSVTSQVVPGADGGEILPPATQGRITWNTGEVVAGRLLRGKTFIPGPCEARSTGGVPLSGYLTALDAAATALLASGSPVPCVYSRKHFVAHNITGGTSWSKWASLRGRRD